jgi:hypothetical protein
MAEAPQIAAAYTTRSNMNNTHIHNIVADTTYWQHNGDQHMLRQITPQSTSDGRTPPFGKYETAPQFGRTPPTENQRRQAADFWDDDPPVAWPMAAPANPGEAAKRLPLPLLEIPLPARHTPATASPKQDAAARPRSARESPPTVRRSSTLPSPHARLNGNGYPRPRPPAHARS